MASDWAITAEHVGKKYLIRHQTGRSYVALRDVMADSAKRAGRRLLRPSGVNVPERSNPGREEFWALQDISFIIKPGERVGIIGRNGAGKSTLLKVLSRITDPSSGRLGIRGRVASLLEVGTGFHPELTGRENIYLNGAILGMGRAEIKRKFDEIVDFAEVERFLDTPVKRYSSGMYVRLAFAVAAHLEPEILIVDEVLAVGDASFQKKCLNKMEDVGQEGRTVLFVSHNTAAITRLCDRAILLDRGCIVLDGPAHRVISVYSKSGTGTSAAQEWQDISRSPGNDVVRLRAARVLSAQGDVTELVDIREPFEVEVEFDALVPGHVLSPSLNFFNDEGLCLFPTHDLDVEWRHRPRPVGRYVSTAHLPGNLFSEGLFEISVSVSTWDPHVTHVYVRDALSVYVNDNLDGDSARGDFAGQMPGVMRPMVPWTSRTAGTVEHEAKKLKERV